MMIPRRQLFYRGIFYMGGAQRKMTEQVCCNANRAAGCSHCFEQKPVAHRHERGLGCANEEWNGDPRKTRTSGLRFRKPPLYPAELWGRFYFQRLTSVILTLFQSVLTVFAIF